MNALHPLLAVLLATLPLPASSEDAVQALIDAAPDGSVIELEARRYATDKALHIDRRSDLTLRGQPGTELVCLSSTEQVISISGSRGITLEGLAAFHDVPTEGCAGGVIWVIASRDIRIESCELNGSGIIGVDAKNVVGLVLERNELHKNSESGIVLDGCREVTLIDNRLHDNGSVGSLRATHDVKAHGNTHEGQPWSPNGSAPVEAAKLAWATTPEDLAKLPDDLRRLALYDFEDATVLQLARFEALEELILTPAEGASGLHLGSLASLPALRSLTVDVAFDTNQRVLAQRIAALDNLEELRLVAERLGKPSFGDKFFSTLLRGKAPLPNLVRLTLDDDATDVTASGLAGLGKLSKLAELTLAAIGGGATNSAWLGPLAEHAPLRRLELSFQSEDSFGVPQLSKDFGDALAELAGLERLSLTGMGLGEAVDLDFVVDLEQLIQLEIQLAPLVSTFAGLSTAAFRSTATLESLEQLVLIGISPEAELERCTRSLASLPKLRSLELDFAPPAELLKKLSYRLEHLTIEADLVDQQWAVLAELSHWSDVRSLSITTRGTCPQSLIEGSRLRELDLVGADVSGLDWGKLAEDCELVELTLRGCSGIDDAALAAFERALPACLVTR